MNSKKRFWARQRASDELEWLRCEEVDPLQLPRPIVLVTGAFDLLHAAHLRLLRCAKEHARSGTVVVAINTDESIREGKGLERPILTWPERASTVWATGLADSIVEFTTESELDALTKRLMPEFKVMGQEYLPLEGRYPFMKEIFIHQSPIGLSTTSIIERVLRAYRHGD